MKILEMNIHIWGYDADPKLLLEQMNEAGVCGGCVTSRPSMEYDATIGVDFEARLQEVLQFCAYAKDRLFPILWLHPDEENVMQKVRTAVERGICGFKVICNDFYIYEEKCLELMRLIASLDKPVLFHSGILWDGKFSSPYNHPMNFEALISIEGLRFSMSHCAWPWVDECIALYGKFMNSANPGPMKAEMFLDLTPGTPEIYREDLLRKLFILGYDIENNIIFGTDNPAHTYNADWTTHWFTIDRHLMDQLGVARIVREKMYDRNLFRFLGLTKEKVAHKVPAVDNPNKWSCENPEVRSIIAKWYDRLQLPKEYDEDFKQALATIPISDAIKIETYDKMEKDGKRNLLSYLFMCEELSKRYTEKGIPENVLLDTLSDVKIWLNIWSELKGELYLGEVAWLHWHFNMEIFRLGRLQFGLQQSSCDCPQYGLKKGDPVIGVHIPADGPMTVEECDASFALARTFFAQHFPEHTYRFFTCHSWLLDPELKNMLPKDSNIIQFQERFINIHNDPSDAILRYVFKWNTTALNLKYAPVLTSFAQTVKKAYMTGTQFHESFGIIEK